MRRWWRTDVRRGRESRGPCSLLYYLDVHDAGAAGAQECVLVHNVVGTAKIAVTPGAYRRSRVRDFLALVLTDTYITLM
jgi:hypothetical protein